MSNAIASLAFRGCFPVVVCKGRFLTVVIALVKVPVWACSTRMNLWFNIDSGTVVEHKAKPYMVILHVVVWCSSGAT